MLNPQPVGNKQIQSETSDQTNSTQTTQHKSKSVEADGHKSDNDNQLVDNSPQTKQKQDSIPTLLKPIQIKKTCISTGNKRWFYCSLPNKVNKWIMEEFIDPDIIQDYWKTHTKTGRRRKRKVCTFFNKNKQ